MSLEFLVKELNKKEMSEFEFFEKINSIKELNCCEINDIEQANFIGLPIELKDQKISLKTKNQNILNQEFCVIDIETNGNSVQEGQIIEIGAFRVKNTKITDKFHSLIHANNVPDAISELTGITENDLKNAPKLTQVLEEFRIFLKDSVFVAHNVKFDYKFISESLQQANLGILLNRKLCTIELSRKIIQTNRYGLGHLKEILNIDTGSHHRALSDAKASARILNFCINHLPKNIKTTENLIKFSISKQDKNHKKIIFEE